MGVLRSADFKLEIQDDNGEGSNTGSCDYHDNVFCRIKQDGRGVYNGGSKEWEDGQLRLGVDKYQTRFYQKNRRHLNKAS